MTQDDTLADVAAGLTKAPRMTDTDTQKLAERLRKRIAAQIERGGDMLYHGQPDPLDVALLARITALEAQVSAYERDMPTILTDPAGKGYACFERPMTPAEAKRCIEDYGVQVSALEAQVAGADARVKEGVERCAVIAEAHSDDRPNIGHDYRWHDGYQDGCRGAATAIREGVGV